MVDELGDIVERKARLEVAEIARGDLEGLPPRMGAPVCRALPQRLVDDVPEGPPGPARFRLEPAATPSSRVSVVRMP